jgi:hypothetical protein
VPESDQRPATQTEWLEYDIAFLKLTTRDHGQLLAPLADTTDSITNNYLETVASFYWAALDYADGVVRMLMALNRPALIPVQRSLLEIVATIKFLCSRDEPAMEAAVFKAYAMLRELEWPITAEARENRLQLLADLPPDVVDTARRRVKARRGWTGMPFRNLLESTGFSSPESYGYFSEQSHSRAFFNNVWWERRPDGGLRLRLGRELEYSEAEHAANFARRMIWQVHHDFWRVFEGPSITWSTEDPFTWSIAERGEA